DCLFTVLFIPKTKQSLRVINLEGFHTLYTIKNDATYSGDGVFLRGKTEDSVLMGSHNNYFEENDVSNSPHNGFEFANSDENEFIANIVNHCDYGFYSHFSKDTIIRNNEIQYNNNEGISLRYAENALIENNDFIGNPIDIYLWEQPNEDMTKKPSLFADKRSYKNVIIGNMHEKVTISGLILEDSTSSEVKKNKYNCEYTYQRTWNNHDIGCALTVISNFDENMNEGDSLGEFKENQFIGLYGKKPVISNQYLSEKEVIAYASSNYWDIDNIDDISVIGHVQIEPVLQI
ncbi:MAG: right-handed parallel beta-helix repeat-containing protein, partial [Nanoarchaeota archaeon]|nr:right-handed parallel beta-helix repeat-containing protein [Nanoarchaeota archaeon]